MKMFSAIVLFTAVFVLPVRTSAQAAAGCRNCAERVATPAAAPAVPEELESLPKGRIESLLPIAMVIVLGCESCAAEAVQWALAQGASRQDIDQELNTIAAVQKIGCFREKFGPDAASRMERPLAAARRALEQATAQNRTNQP